jgi:uncharacterized protein (DUF58 family)
MHLENWVNALLVVFFIGAVTRQPWPVAFSVAAAVVFLMTSFWQRHALDRIRYTRKWTYRRGFPGEHLSVQIEIENRKLLPVSWVRVTDTWPTAVGPSDETILIPSHIETSGELINLYSLRWFQRIVRLYMLTLRQRGVHHIGPAVIQSGDLFGMADTSLTLEKQDNVVVFPELLAMSSLPLPAQDPFGSRRSLQRLFEDPTQTMSIRPYQPEDGFRRIHWPATARTGELQVKVFQPVSARVMMICLNASTQAQYWLGIDQGRLEYLIKIAATLAYQGVMDGYSVGLLSNGCLSLSDQPFHLIPGRSTDHLALLLGSLAAVTAYTLAPFESYLIKAMPKIPYGASLLVISALITPELSTSLLRLKRYRTHITLLSLAPQPLPAIPGVHAVQLEYPEG